MSLLLVSETVEKRGGGLSPFPLRCQSHGPHQNGPIRTNNILMYNLHDIQSSRNRKENIEILLKTKSDIIFCIIILSERAYRH